MKLTICLLAILTVLCIVSVHARQSPPNESLAYARLIAAHKLPTVTRGQCSSAQGDWMEKDKADKEEPWWYQRLSTEELARMASLATACATEAMKNQENSSTISVGAFVGRARQFDNVLLNRAETVLRGHALIEDYLLQP